MTRIIGPMEYPPGTVGYADQRQIRPETRPQAASQTHEEAIQTVGAQIEDYLLMQGMDRYVNRLGQRFALRVQVSLEPIEEV